MPAYPTPKDLVLRRTCPLGARVRKAIGKIIECLAKSVDVVCCYTGSLVRFCFVFAERVLIFSSSLQL